MEEELYYLAVLHCLGRKRKVVISSQSEVLASYLSRGYVVELLDTIPVIDTPALD